MFENNLLAKLSDAIPTDVKEKVIETIKETLSGNADDLKSSAMQRPEPLASKTSPVAPPEAVEASAGSDDATADLAVEQPEAAEGD